MENQRIAHRMLAINRAQRDGQPLEIVPLPVDDMTLENALSILQTEFDLHPESV